MQFLFGLVGLVLGLSIGPITANANTTVPEKPTSDQLRNYYTETSLEWRELPQVALLAFAASEDRKFFERPPERSTLTMIIAGWLLPPGKEKSDQIQLSLTISGTFAREEILAWYVNEVFLGQRCFGVADAARAYFGKAVEDLSIEELAYLAAIPKAPALFHPVRSYERAIKRRNFALSEMRKVGLIAAGEAKQAMQKALRVLDPLGHCS